MKIYIYVGGILFLNVLIYFLKVSGRIFFEYVVYIIGKRLKYVNVESFVREVEFVDIWRNGICYFLLGLFFVFDLDIYMLYVFKLNLFLFFMEIRIFFYIKEFWVNLFILFGSGCLGRESFFLGRFYY